MFIGTGISVNQGGFSLGDVLARGAILTNVLPGATFDLDVTLPGGWDEDQTITNLNGNTSEDYWLGVAGETSRDPVVTDYQTVNGRIVFQAGNVLTIKNNSLFANNIHKTPNDTSITGGIVFNLNTVGTSQCLISTANATSHHGIILFVGGDRILKLFQYNGSGLSQTIPLPAVQLNAGTDYLLVFALDKENNQFKIALNSNTFSTASLIYGATTTDATGLLTLGATSLAKNSTLSNNSYIKSFFGFNSVITDNNLQTIVQLFNQRHNTVYA